MLLTSVLSGALGFAADNVTLSLVFILTALYLWCQIRPGLGRTLPPSPWQFPVIGSLPFLALGPDKLFTRLGRKYGDIYCAHFGDENAVILSSYTAIKEAFVTNGENFSGRKRNWNLLNYLWSNKGIAIEDGLAWKEQRRFALSALRDFGFGRFCMEDKIHEEADKVAECLRSSQGSPVELRRHFLNAASNVISALTFGKNFAYDDPEFVEVRENIIDLEKKFRFPLAAFMPWTRHLLPSLNGIADAKKFKTAIKGFLGKYINQHKATFDEKMLRDYLDCYLAEMYKRQKINPDDVGSFDEIRLRSNLFIMFFAGVSTTNNTLNWAFRMLLAHPEMQVELQEEIDRVVGANRQVAYADRTQMPRTEAFLCEVQRYGDVVPLGVAHTNLEATTLFGYEIPKRTTIISNIRSVHQDPALWGDPENFRPSRFINEQGVIVKPEYLIPFGVGKRFCMGEALARMELFLILTTMLQKFSFAPTEGFDIRMGKLDALARQPPDYKVYATPRQV